MKYLIISLLIVISTCMLSGCSSTPIKFPAISAKDVELDRGREVSGRACGFQLFLVIPININGRYEEAYEQLMGQAGREAVANLRIEESWFYGFVGTGYCTKLMATAYPKKPQP